MIHHFHHFNIGSSFLRLDILVDLFLNFWKLFEIVKNEDWEGRSPYQPPIEALALDATSSTYSTIILVSTLPTFPIDN